MLKSGTMLQPEHDCCVGGLGFGGGRCRRLGAPGSARGIERRLNGGFNLVLLRLGLSLLYLLRAWLVWKFNLGP